MNPPKIFIFKNKGHKVTLPQFYQNITNKKRPVQLDLWFEQKKAIFDSFPELTRKVNKYGWVEYDFLGGNARKKEIARELTHTNVYICWMLTGV